MLKAVVGSLKTNNGSLETLTTLSSVNGVRCTPISSYVFFNIFYVEFCLVLTLRRNFSACLSYVVYRTSNSWCQSGVDLMYGTHRRMMDTMLWNWIPNIFIPSILKWTEREACYCSSRRSSPVTNVKIVKAIGGGSGSQARLRYVCELQQGYFQVKKWLM